MQDTSKMTPRELYEYRIKLYHDAQSWKKPDRIPINGHAFTWIFIAAGYSPTEATRSYDLINKCLVHYVNEYKVDQINIGSSGYRNPFLISDSLGGSDVYTDKEADKLNVITEDLMRPDEYEYAMNNFPAWSWEAIMRKFPHIKEMTPQNLIQSMRIANEYYAQKEKSNLMLREQYGSLAELDTYDVSPVFDDLFNVYRGLKGVSMDLRRKKAQLDLFCETQDNKAIARFRDWLDKQPYGRNAEETYDISIGLLGHTIVNRKQFDKYYAPLIEAVCAGAQEKGKHVQFFSEGMWERFGDFFNQFKKGTVSMMVEEDNIFELREKYPNICLMGGIDIDLLSSGTPDQCIESVKKVIDELGREGGLILQPSKMVSFANDCKPENLKAIADFVTSYDI